MTAIIHGTELAYPALLVAVFAVQWLRDGLMLRLAPARRRTTSTVKLGGKRV